MAPHRHGTPSTRPRPALDPPSTRRADRLRSAALLVVAAVGQVGQVDVALGVGVRDLDRTSEAGHRAQERVAAQHGEGARGRRPDRGGAGDAAQEGQLAEPVARAEVAQEGATLGDLHAPRGDDVEGVAEVASGTTQGAGSPAGSGCPRTSRPTSRGVRTPRKGTAMSRATSSGETSERASARRSPGRTTRTAAGSRSPTTTKAPVVPTQVINTGVRIAPAASPIDIVDSCIRNTPTSSRSETARWSRVRAATS